MTKNDLQSVGNKNYITILFQDDLYDGIFLPLCEKFVNFFNFFVIYNYNIKDMNKSYLLTILVQFLRESCGKLNF